MIDAEARVQDRVQRPQQPLALAHVVHHHVRAHGLTAGGQRPHVQVVHAPHAGHTRDRRLDLAERQVGGSPLQQNVHRLA